MRAGASYYIRSDVPALILTLSFCEALQNAVIEGIETEGDGSLLV